MLQRNSLSSLSQSNAENMEYESHKERCPNHDAAYDIEYKSHKERCVNNVKYESKRKAEQEGGVKLSYAEKRAHLCTTYKVKAVDIVPMCHLRYEIG